jgi:hypothetical protein
MARMAAMQIKTKNVIANGPKGPHGVHDMVHLLRLIQK